jgi:hypothetical protein
MVDNDPFYCEPREYIRDLIPATDWYIIANNPPAEKVV